MSSAVDLTVRVANLPLPNPVLTASGCTGAGAELSGFLDLASLGGVVTRSVRRDEAPGRPAGGPVEAVGGLLGGGGGQAAGIDSFVSEGLAAMLDAGGRPVVSIAADTLGEYAELADRLAAEPGVAAVEVNLAWAVGTIGVSVADLSRLRRSLSVVRRETPSSRPVLAKLPCDAGSIVDLAATVVDAGADGVVLAGPARGLAIDPATLLPLPVSVGGGLCGPATKPLVVRSVWEVHAAFPDLPVVAVGGVRSGGDALEYLACGASAIQVGSVLLLDPSRPLRVIAELDQLLGGFGFAAAADAVGVTHRSGAGERTPGQLAESWTDAS